jgi:hypothetical protein
MEEDEGLLWSALSHLHGVLTDTMVRGANRRWVDLGAGAAEARRGGMAAMVGKMAECLWEFVL